ncbi:hypothetical protein [Cystobacter ferrugineus]|nr:hypothetical protein [Cystobacter ferrugineus]
MPWLSFAIGWSSLVGAVVLGACLTWLGTGRSIPLVPILVVGSTPWLTAIGVGLGSRTLLMRLYGQGIKGDPDQSVALILSGELQSYLLTALLYTISLQTAAMLVLWVEASREHRGSSPERPRPGRWSSRTAAALATVTLGFCLLAVLHTWAALYPVSL